MKPTPVIRSAFVLLGLISAAYLLRGFYLLTLGSGGWDFQSRWLEQQYIYLGIPPYDAMKGSPLLNPALGAVHSGGYFAWSFFIGSALSPPGLSLAAARIWFACLNVLALTGIALFVLMRMAPFGRERAWLATLMALAISGHSTTLAHGHYGILINAILCLMLVLLERGQGVTAGLCFGMAMVKPTITGLFLLPLAFKGKAPALLAFALFFALANLVIWQVTGTDPWQMNLRVFRWLNFVREGSSALNLGMRVGFSAQQAVFLIAGFGLLLATWLTWQLRKAPLLTQFALPAVIGRLATYHRSYDDVMLLFLLLPLIQLAFEHPRRRAHTFVVLLVGASLWAPFGGSAPNWLLVLKGVVWLLGLGWLVIQARKSFPASHTHQRNQHW